MELEAILLVGIQASGKSTFYKENYFNSHLRISNDLLRTKNREKMLFDYCFSTSMPLVIDNTNATREVRAKYIQMLRQHKYAVKCYYFKADLERALSWNNARTGRDCIPQVGIFATHKKMEIPCKTEGFDELYYIDFVDGKRIVKVWEDEI